MSRTPEKPQQAKQNLFTEAVSDITPLEQDRIIPLSDKNRSFVAQTDFEDDLDEAQLAVSDEFDPFENEQQRYDLNFHQLSISKKLFRLLKNSQFEYELILDLHGCNKQQALHQLQGFLLHCQQHDFRRVAIMPGYGHGILRRSLNIWLRQIPQVLAFAESPRNAGGKGVIRLLLAANDDHSTLEV